MSSPKHPKPISVPTSLGDAVGEAGESDLNGGFHWHLMHPWGDAQFAGTRREALNRLKRLVHNLDKESDS